MKAPSRQEVLEEFQVQRVQEATLRVVSRKGLASATMQEIADEAGVAKGTIYIYFKGREDLLRRTADLAFARLIESLESTLSGSRPFGEALCALIQTKIEFFHAHRQFFRIYLAMCHPQGESSANRLRREHHPQYAVYLDRLASFLREAMGRGEVSEMDPSRLALFLAEGTNAIIRRRLSEDSPPPPEGDVEWIVAALVSGVSRKRSSS